MATRYRLNLDLSAKVMTKGSIRGFLNWTTGDVERIQPALWILRKVHNGSNMVCLPLSDLSRFVNSDGYTLPNSIALAIRISMMLGYPEMDRETPRDILDMIANYAPELVKMPPYPPNGWDIEQAAGGPKAELSLVMDGKTVMETEVDARDI